MATVASPNGQGIAPPVDGLDQLLDYDEAVQDFMRDIPIGNDQQNTTTRNEEPRDEDQEVQVKKKRKPVPKLDENLYRTRTCCSVTYLTNV